MKDYSLIEKLNILMNMVSSSPLFMVCFMVAIALLVLYIINLKSDKKINKWFFIGVWLFLMIILFIRYNSVVYNLFDNLFDNIFTALFFPNLTVYIVILIISNFVFIYSILKKDENKAYKLINFINALSIDILLILIVDTVKTNSLNVHEALTLYSNSNLLVLLELTTALFTSWLLINLFISAKIKLKKFDKPEPIILPEIVFDEV